MAADADREHRTLLQRAGDGDRPSLDSLLERHLPQLMAFVRLRMGAALRGRESCSDIVQSVCRELIERECRGFEYRGEGAFRQWLCLAALNKIRKRARWHRARPAAAVADADASYRDYCASVFTPSQAAMDREAAGRLEAAFDALPDHYREVITMARIAGMSHAEIGAATGRTEVAARQLLHRALAALTDELTRTGFLRDG